MRPSTFFAHALLFAFSPSPVASAWQPFAAVKRDIIEALEARAPATSYDLSYSATQGNTATTETSATESASGSDGAPTPTATQSGAVSESQSGSATGSGSGSTTGGGSKTNSGSATTGGSSKGSKTTSTYISIDPQAPPGGVQMITPSALATSSYYKIMDNVNATFAWNYTSLSVTPTAVDILISCSSNSATYTLAANQSISGSAGAITWDTGAFQTQATPLLTAEYTLIIHDASKDIDAIASPGYMSTFSQFTFGMYSPYPYTPIEAFTCVTCSGAATMQRQTMGFMLGMVMVTVFSFTWFAGVAGLW